ncbi:C-GCAxxG-C-C family protein [Oscillospiraceae bacterium LTW-04]|nr:C-GCAxxG-C-C family protein [Oscillospiraceae bacterium MB24-C1]
MEERVYDYFITQDYNCAETILMLANDEYGLGLREQDFKLVSAFGGGLGCEKTCGALCGALAAIGCLKVTDRAHATENFKELCADFVQRFEDDLGSIDCDVLKLKYRDEETRCLKTVELAAKALEDYIKEI